MGKLTIYKYVRLENGWRYCRAALHPNGKIKANTVVVRGWEERHHEGSYYLAHGGQWIVVGDDAFEAQHRRALKLNAIECERLEGKSAAVAAKKGQKPIEEEVKAYLANLELAKRPRKTVESKRKFLALFLSVVSKKFLDEFTRDDVLKFRNKLMSEYEPKSVNTMMMCVVTFFNQWVKAKLGIKASDWPEYDENPPEPYSDEEVIAIERHTSGDANQLVRLFRSSGCRDMEIAHLTSNDLSVRTKEVLIRPKPCFHCADCVSRGNLWKPKTKAGTRAIPIGDSLFAELLRRPKGLLFPNEDGNPDAHFLDKLKKAAKGSGVEHVKLHRFRDTFITNKLRDGVDVRTMQRWAGHSDINVTMSYCAWLDGQSKAARDAANREDTRYKTGTHGD